MPIVAMPDGTRVQFPDDMPSERIRGLIAQKFPSAVKPLDKYQQAAVEEDKSIGGAPNAGYTRRLTHGATLGADTTIMAGLQTPLEMVKRGTLDPREAYNYAKAREDFIMDKSRENTGMLGTATEALGGGVSAMGLAKGGITASRFLPQEAGLLKRTAAGAADAAGIGGISGFMEGNGLSERTTNAAKGFAVGGLIGGLSAPAIDLVKVLATPITSLIKAKTNPRAYAESQVSRAISESGLTPDEVQLAIVQAKNEGQGVFTLADALGNSGQRMLSTVTRSPGEGRTAVVEALNARQGDQGRRLSTSLREAFDAPQTAEQTRQGLVRQANAEANVNYAPVKSEAQPIDVSSPVALANRSISPAADNLARAQGALPTDIAARSGIERSESALRDPIGRSVAEARSYLASDTLTSSNVGKAFRAKTNIDQMIAKATENKQGGLVAELVPIRDALDEQLARTSKSYAAARDAYKLRQQRIEALDKGRETGSRPGRPEDAIDQFNPLDAEAKQAFRAGYVDPYVSQMQNAAFGVNKARPLTSDAVTQEFNAFAAPGRAEELQRKIARENAMFQTRNEAMGGSKTADNLNDDAAMAVSPEVIGVLKNIVSGNFGGAVKGAIAAGQNSLTGNTAAVRQAVADMLLQNGNKIPPNALQKMVDGVLKKALRATQIADGITRGATGGATVAAPGQQRR